MAITAIEAASLQHGDVIRIASREEIDRTNLTYWADTMYEYCDKEVIVETVTTGSTIQVYMIPQEPRNCGFYFLPEWIAEVVGRDDEYTIQPPGDFELLDFLFVKERKQDG